MNLMMSCPLIQTVDIGQMFNMCCRKTFKLKCIIILHTKLEMV